MTPRNKPISPCGKAPCSHCKRGVTNRSRAIACAHCELWVHITCEPLISVELYNALMKHPQAPLDYCCQICRKLKPSTDNMNTANVSTQTTTSQETTKIKTKTAKTQTTTHQETTTAKTHTAKGSRNSRNRPAQDKASDSNPSELPHSNNTSMTGPLNLRTDNVLAPIAARTIKISSVREPTKCDKAQGTQEIHISPNTLIVLNAPECTANSLITREAADTSIWRDLCQMLKVPQIDPKRIVRIGPKTGTRPMRVELHATSAVDTILIAGSTLRANSDSKIRVSPDLPWHIRQIRQKARQAGGDPQRRCNVILHGIPESPLADPQDACTHDAQQWAFIRNKLGLSPLDARVCNISRIPRPLHLSNISAPRLLRVSLITEEMASTVLSSWDTSHNMFPRDIRVHQDRPRCDRTQSRGPPQVSKPVSVSIDPIPPQPQPTSSTSTATIVDNVSANTTVLEKNS